MLKNKSAKGRKGDNIVIDRFAKYLKADIFVISAGSKGVSDLAISNGHHTFWIQSKFTSSWPKFEEEENLCKLAGKMDLRFNSVLCCWINSKEKGRYEDRFMVRKYYPLLFVNGIQYLDYDDNHLFDYFSYHKRLQKMIKDYTSPCNIKALRYLP